VTVTELFTINLALLSDETLYAMLADLHAVPESADREMQDIGELVDTIAFELEETRDQRVCWLHLRPVTRPDGCTRCAADTGRADRIAQLKRELAGA